MIQPVPTAPTFKSESRKGFFVYSRKSSEAEDRQVLSIASQIEELKKLSLNLGLPIQEILTEAKSAKAPGRPVFNQMMQRIYRGEAEGIFCWKLDRLARNPVDGGSIIWAIKQHGIKIVTPTQTYSHGDDNTILMYIEFGMAQKYIDDLSRNVKRGLRMKAEQGWQPGVAPLGYLNQGERAKGLGWLVPDPERFSLLRKMWDLVLEGRSVSEVITIGDQEWGFRTRPNKREAGKPLAKSSLYKILTNPFYYGEFEYPHGSGIWYKGSHQPMVTREEYRQVQKILGRPDRPRRKTHTFAFTGLIHCGECGAMVTAEEKWKRHKNGNVHHYIYYHCTKRINPCSQRSIEEKDLESQVDACLSRIQIPESFKDWAVKCLREEEKRERDNQSSIYGSLRKTYNDTEKALSELVRMRYLGMIDNAEYERERAGLKLELANLEERLNGGQERTDSSLESSEKVFTFACHARERFLGGDAQTKKEILATLGSNLQLKDKNLKIEAKKPFLIIEEGLKRLPAKFPRFEPPKFVATQRENALSGASVRTLRRGRDSNSRCPFGHTGFRDRPIQPLWHPSWQIKSIFTLTRRKLF